jgi:hypothetical protein
MPTSPSSQSRPVVAARLPGSALPLAVHPQGTSRATKYHVLVDENKFSADGLQGMIYKWAAWRGEPLSGVHAGPELGPSQASPTVICCRPPPNHPPTPSPTCTNSHARPRRPAITPQDVLPVLSLHALHLGGASGAVCSPGGLQGPRAVQGRWVPAPPWPACPRRAALSFGSVSHHPPSGPSCLGPCRTLLMGRGQ